MDLIIASYISVFVKAFQQRNVAFNNYLFVPVWKLATGAVLGCWCAMYLHNKLTNAKNDFESITNLMKEPT